MARQIIHDHDVAGAKFRYEHLRHIGFEPVAIDWTIKDHGRDHAGHPQPGDQRGRLAVAVGEAHPQTLTSGAPPVAAGHVCRGPGLVDEHETFGFQIELAVEPVLALPQDVGTVLLDRVPGLFLRVMPRRSKNRHKVPIPM